MTRPDIQEPGTHQPGTTSEQTSRPDRRVLITGSRTWTDTVTIRAALTAVWHPDTILVSGACLRGADALCEACWRAWGGQIERHPADWQTHGRVAGMRRNTAMVALGADVCLAFIHHQSPGATHTAAAADAAGIPTYRYTQQRPAGQPGGGDQA